MRYVDSDRTVKDQLRCFIDFSIKWLAEIIKLPVFNIGVSMVYTDSPLPCFTCKGDSRKENGFNRNAKKRWPFENILTQNK